MKKSLSLLVVTALGLALGGCGFQPLYGEGERGLAESALLDMQVAPQTTRTGQLVRNALLSGIAPAASRGGHTLLDFTATESEKTSISFFSSGDSRRRLILDVAYVLKDRDSGKTLHSGKTFSEVPYTVTDQPVADMQARIHARETAARVVARDMRNRLAAWFAARG